MSDVTVERDGPVAVVTINRPHALNAISPAVQVGLADAWAEIRADRGVRVAVLTGAGTRAFCSGADLKLLVPLLTGAREPVDDADRRVLSGERPVFSDLGKPLIAAVNGDAVAGGMELVQAADIRVAAEHARFGLQEVRWGLFPAGGSTVRLPRQVPSAVAMELLLTGELISAARAYEIGFLNRVVAAGDAVDAAVGIAKRVASNGPLAVQAVRESARANIAAQEPQLLAIEAAYAARVFASSDAIEGPRAFLEKRAPRFEGA